MEFRHLNYVTEIARQKSFTKAAEKLYITQPNISKQIKLLEEELGTTLFIRTSHQVELTPDGEIFCQRAQKILDDFDLLMKEFNHQTSQDKAILNIAVFPAFQRSGIAKKLQTFYREHANVLGTIRMADNFVAYDGLEDGSIDFAIIKVRPKTLDSRFEYKLLEKEEMLGLISSSSEFANKEKLLPEDLAQLPLLTGEKGTHLFQDAFDICNELNIPFNVSYQNTFNVDLTTSFIQDIDGVMFLTKSTADTFQDSDTTAIPLDPPVEYNTYLVYLKGRKFHGIYKTFIKFMQDRL
jgi:DNA-binding transcriptional LysR family regulator